VVAVSYVEAGTVPYLLFTLYSQFGRAKWTVHSELHLNPTSQGNLLIWNGRRNRGSSMSPAISDHQSFALVRSIQPLTRDRKLDTASQLTD
jgi:hypothetical protein